jgi:PleD family two-component response regulator
VSIGLVTTIYMDKKTLPQTFLKTADQNLYLAKHNGRNQIVSSMIYDWSMMSIG